MAGSAGEYQQDGRKEQYQQGRKWAQAHLAQGRHIKAGGVAAYMKGNGRTAGQGQDVGALRQGAAG